MKANKMLKKIFLSSAITLIASASYAQDAHKGHQHGPQPQAGNAVQGLDLSKVDFVFSEAPDDHVVGGDFAPITIIAYASVTCSHCSNWFTNEWPDVKASLVETDKIRFVFREFPTAPAALSLTGFAMANCAPKEDFFSVVEYQMENQAEIIEQTQQGKGQEVYGKIAKLAGLDTDEKVAACLTAEREGGHIEVSLDRAAAAKVQGVPAFYINGDAYKGKQSAKDFIELIDTMIETGSSSLPK